MKGKILILAMSILVIIWAVVYIVFIKYMIVDKTSWINNVIDKNINNTITQNSTYDKILDIYDKNYDSIVNGNYNYVEWENSIENGSYINLSSNYNYNCDNEKWICILDKISPFDNIPINNIPFM